MTSTTSTTPEEPPAWVQMEEEAAQAAMSQISILVGAVFSLLLALVLDLPMRHLFALIGLGDSLLVNGVFVLTVGSLYFLWGLDNIPIGFRGVVLFLGRRLLRNGKGLSEGYQWTPQPIMFIRQVDCKPKSIDISDEEGAYTSDGVLIATNGIQRLRVGGPYRFLGVDDAVLSLERLARQAVRIVMKQKTAVQARNADKKDFSDEVARVLHAQLYSTNNPNAVMWGLNTGTTIIDDIWAVDEKLEAAWAAQVREQAEGVAEAVQTARRREQAQQYINMGASPDLAVIAAQTDVEKPHASISATALPGIPGAITAAANALAEAIKGWSGSGRK
ncbi:hypothetical protein HYS79_03045 [Patescibacteria group bacterium]|nr:hypothetical protein [Patescibacteria group bacterium]